MTLIINTTVSIISLALFDKEAETFIFDKRINLDGNLSEQMLTTIDKELMKEGLSKKDITEVWINVGPGSYTGLRIGVTTANFLAFSLNTPIYGYQNEDEEKIEEILKTEKKANQKFIAPVLPVYKYPPHITQQKH